MSVFDVKLVLLGSSSCGKSTLLHRLMYGRYRPGLPPTYGTEFGAKRVEVTVPAQHGGSDINGGSREGRSRGASGRASIAGGGGGNGSGNGRRGLSVGVWDTSGAARFHSQSRRFIAGADAVLVCWDASSRDSWEAMRAWVADARAEDPGVRIYLAACKSDLVQRHNHVPHIDVQVERWPSHEQQQQQRSRPHSPLPQQHQQDARQPTLQQQGVAGKPPLHGGTPSGMPERLPAAPRTPLKAERPQSPVEELEAEAEAALLAAGRGHEAAAAAAAGRQVLAEHRAAAAAELVSSLTGQSLPSPFAAAAARPLSPAEELEAGSSGAGSAASTRGGSLPASLSSAAPSMPSMPSVPAERAASAEGGTTEWPSAPRRRRSGGMRVRLQSASPEDAAAGAGAAQRQSSESDELPSPSPAPLQQPAVPEAAVDQYSASLGTHMFWVSAKTGEGVLDAVTAIAQDVIDQRVMLWRLQQAQQAQQAQQGGRRSPWGSQHGAALAPQQAQQARQAQQAQRGRSRSADSYSGQPAGAESSLAGSRGRAVRRGTSTSGSSVRSMRSASAGQAGREYVVRGSELGSSIRQPEEPSCVIC